MLTPLLAAALLLAGPTPAAGTPVDLGDAVLLPLQGPPGIDHVALDAAASRLWIPAGSTGQIAVVDLVTGRHDLISGQAHDKGQPLGGPSSAAAGDGMVYVGNRADRSVCAFDARTRARRGCVSLPIAPDGLAYVASTRQVWVTIPDAKALAVLDAARPAEPTLAATMTLPGEPEGYAVDAGRGLFYTNLEDADLTVAVDVKLRQVVSTWRPGCGEAGPRGLAFDPARRFLFVACTDGLRTLAAGQDGAVLGTLTVGEGVDSIAYVAETREVYVPTAKDGKLTAVAVTPGGLLGVSWREPTATGCQTLAADAAGVAYLPDARGKQVLVVRPPAPRAE